MNTRRPAPAVSIGLPVYNGERHLAETINSFLAQAYRDFELIICDDASHDRTEMICREYAASDSRIRYYRGVRHIGLAENFNRAFLLSHGRYFKWAAVQELCRPPHLAECVRALDADPGAAMAFTGAKLLDSHGDPGSMHRQDRGTESPSAMRRYRASIFGESPSVAVSGSDMFFGLYRRSVLSRTNLIDPIFRNNSPLLVRCALIGRFICIDGALVLNQNRAWQSARLDANRIDDRGSFAGDLDHESTHATNKFVTSQLGTTPLPQCLTARDHLLAISQTPLSPMQKRLCRFWWAMFVARNAPKLLNELLEAGKSRFLASDRGRNVGKRMDQTVHVEPIMARIRRAQPLKSPFPRRSSEINRAIGEELSA
jgi:glycosyltransferase involved in cell wall biosynthesis